ncbi:hypothetical protein [Symmachiella dynata]|uniref:hypothetical protein n=1 Tax=Symmachiella dynata TaxID=2527995 RepID=UPI0030EC7C26
MMMSSVSDSDYQKHAVALLRLAVERPRMFYSKLWELELIMDGHFMAFEQLFSVPRANSFKVCFSDWLTSETSVSCSGGWALAVDNLASKREDDSDTLFAKLVDDFVPIWTDTNLTDLQ